MPKDLEWYEDYVRLAVKDRAQRLKRPVYTENLLLELCGEIGELINAHKHFATWQEKGHEITLRDCEALPIPQVEKTERAADLYTDAEFEKEQDLVSELGDVLWYLTAVIQSLGFSVGQVARGNHLKLLERYGDLETLYADGSEQLKVEE